jgi:hypothetical protein
MESFELCLAFLLGASVGYTVRAAISNLRRAEVRRQRREELARAVDREMVVQEQAGSGFAWVDRRSCSDNHALFRHSQDALAARFSGDLWNDNQMPSGPLPVMTGEASSLGCSGQTNNRRSRPTCGKLINRYCQRIGGE